MFCKNCGSPMEDGAAFCPNCGDKVIPDGFQPVGSMNNEVYKQQQKGNQRKVFLAVGISAALLVVIAVVAVLAISLWSIGGKHVEQYSVVGEWYSRDAITFGEILQEQLAEQGNNEIVTAVLSTMLGNLTGKLNLTFTDSGSVYIGIDNVLVSLGEFTYEDLGNNRMLLRWEMDISILGTGLPISVAYRADYQVSKDTLQLDLFGHDVVFERAER